MRPIIYDVAVSLDGFIADASGDASRFPHDDAVVEDYVARLAGYGTALMGRATYEYGYAFGLEPGANPYPHMDCNVISSRPLPGGEVPVHADPLASARARKERDGAPIYLCGGGALAGALLAAGLIDRLIVKCAPILIGAGVPLFAGGAAAQLRPVSARPYEGGTVLREFEIA